MQDQITPCLPHCSRALRAGGDHDRIDVGRVTLHVLAIVSLGWLGLTVVLSLAATRRSP